MAPNNPFLQLVSFIFSAIALPAVFLQVNSAKDTFVSEECNSCESEQCIIQTNNLIKHMNPNQDPCQDFYSFACGGYLERFGEDDTRSVYDDSWNRFLIQIKDLLEHLKPEKGSASEKMKKVFDICMDKESSEFHAVPDAIDFLSKVGISDWPNLDSDFQFADLSETLGSLATYGEFAFMTFQPSPYEKTNENKHLPSALILPDKYLLDSKLNPIEVKNAVMKILSFFDVEAQDLESMWENFKSIEDKGIKLQNEEAAENARCKDNSPVYSKINCSGEVQGNMAFLCIFWKSAVRTGKLDRYYSHEILHISCRWNHYSYITSIISSLDSINHRSLANYLCLRFFTSHLDDFNLYFRLLKYSFSKPKDSTRKTPESIHRAEYCVGWIMKSMHLALGYEYTQRFLKEPIENNILDIIQEYVQELSKNIESLKWMTMNAKFSLKKMLEKLEIGFKTSMKKFKNETSITNYYKEFEPVRGSFLKNILEFTKSSNVMKRENAQFNSFSSSSDYYNMDFGLSLLMPPTYSYGLPKMLNYASLGWIIAHELSHNFKFFFDIVPLDDEMENNINARVKCYEKHFSTFLMEKTGKSNISRETEEEIIADCIGWELTEKILNFSDETNDIRLPGLEFTPQQIMYISFAQDSCAALSREVEKEFYTSKPHNIQKLRVLNVLQNSKIFSKVFNCSSDQVMNPPTKCSFFD